MSFSFTDIVRLQRFVLDHDRTITLSEFHDGDRDVNAFSGRHDVDHDVALHYRFALWEADQGIRTTYFLLPTADGYSWPDEARDYGLRMQALGHEIGLHNDAMVVCEGDVDAALDQLRAWADEMRSWGLVVRGCADHGGAGYDNTAIWRVHNRLPSEAGLEWEAYLLHQLHTNYISDNQGEWRAPLERVPDRPTHMLVHWEHWGHLAGADPVTP